MNDLHEKACLCALNRLFGFQPKTGLALLSHLESASVVFSLSDKDLDYILGPFSKHKEGIRPQNVEVAVKELEQLHAKGIEFIGWTDARYPHLLKECEDAPIGLYVRSATSVDSLFSFERSVAIVGTRDISSYGREWCERIVAGLARCQERPVIVSGLALGTDICAHTTALESGLSTIGVMATGPDDIYPWRHQGFAERIVTSEGSALITDYPPETAPLAIHFLRRNRIIAGLCQATILIESRIKGGGMTTARLAFGYSRDVFALPGRVDDQRSQGCNYLIKGKIAEPITSVEDLIEELSMKNCVKTAKSSDLSILMKRFKSGLPEDKIGMMSKILILIRANRGISTEEIAVKTGTEYNSIMHLIRLLENDGFIDIDLAQRCCINSKKFIHL